MPITIDVVKKYSPVLYFHPDEHFFPCSIEYLLSNSNLTNSLTGQTIPNPNQSTLRDNSSADWYVKINPTQFGGEGVGAPIYYAIQEYTDCIRINYLMLYAYQGGQTCRVLRPINPFDCIIQTLGIHQGDLERVFVTLVPNSAGGYTVVQVGFEAHGKEQIYTSQRVLWEGTHPVVKVALNGHSSWNGLLFDDRVVEESVPLVIAVISALGSNGNVWRPDDFRLLGLDRDRKPTSDQLWAAFKGKLGADQTNKLESATYFNGGDLSLVDWGWVEAIDFLAKLTGQYTHELTHGNGPAGPGSREWITQPSGPLFGAIVTLQANDYVGQGPNAVYWLSGRFASTTRDQIVQCWSNSGRLGMIEYGIDQDRAFRMLSINPSIAPSSDAVAWLTGDFFGDERMEIVQCFADGESLGMVMYGDASARGLSVLWSSRDTGQGAAAIQWLVGDFNGDGKDEIVQCYADGDNLGMIAYDTDDAGAFRVRWKSPTAGYSPNTVAWLVGDFNGDGKKEIIQGWSNGQKLGMVMYGDVNGILAIVWQQAEIGPSATAVYWLAGDFNGDGKDEIVQCWSNGDRLGMTMYGMADTGSFQLLWSNSTMGLDWNALAWFAETSMATASMKSSSAGLRTTMSSA